MKDLWRKLPHALTMRFANDGPNTHWTMHIIVATADPILGIFGATPVETMHAFCKGVIEVVTFLVLDECPQKAKSSFRPSGSFVS